MVEEQLLIRTLFSEQIKMNSAVETAGEPPATQLALLFPDAAHPPLPLSPNSDVYAPTPGRPWATCRIAAFSVWQARRISQGCGDLPSPGACRPSRSVGWSGRNAPRWRCRLRTCRRHSNRLFDPRIRGQTALKKAPMSLHRILCLVTALMPVVVTAAAGAADAGPAAAGRFDDAIADSIAGFSATQGRSNWSCGSRPREAAEGTTQFFFALPHNQNNIWRLPDSGVEVGRTLMTAGQDRVAVRRWRADRPGSVRLSPGIVGPQAVHRVR